MWRSWTVPAHIGKSNEMKIPQKDKLGSKNEEAPTINGSPRNVSCKLFHNYSFEPKNRFVCFFLSSYLVANIPYMTAVECACAYLQVGLKKSTRLSKDWEEKPRSIGNGEMQCQKKENGFYSLLICLLTPSLQLLFQRISFKSIAVQEMFATHT